MSLAFRSKLLVLAAAVSATHAQGGLAPKAYLPLPLGSIKPAGWLHDQVAIQSNGLAGHEHEFYNYIAQSDWTGGDALYSNLEEAGSYWFNGLVPNAVIMDDSDLQSTVQNFLNYVISHQDTDGWLGPEVGTNKTRYLWGRYPFMFGITQLLEYDPGQADTVVPALYKFVKLANTMLHNNGEGTEEWGNSRWEDFAITLQWLYDFYPQGNEAMLLDTMQQLKWQGYAWENIFDEQYFPKTATENLTPPFGYDIAWHGVNVAEGLKALAAQYRFTNNASDITRASSGWDLLFEYHGRPSGAFAADEYLAGLDAIRGTELCLIVETMYSGSYLYQVIGDLKYADRVERITYNALPATLTPTMWSRQYLQQQNQVGAKNMSPDPFPRDGAYSNVFGLEPNYPCCTVNFPQGYPKFVTNSFVKTPDNSSLVQVYLGPFNTKTVLFGGTVSVSTDTLYPFGDTLTTTITSDHDFTYYVRVPSWVSKGTIAINGGEVSALAPTNGLQAVPVKSGSTTLVLELPSEITVESRPGSSVAIHRGPLHYAFDIPRNQVTLATNGQQPLAIDLEYDAAGTWQYAIDTSTLLFNNNPPSSGSLPSPIYDAGNPPVTITVLACPISWGLAGDTFADSPPVNPNCTGAAQNITLWPYGATKLRIGEFPTVKLI